MADLVIALLHRVSRKLMIVPWHQGSEEGVDTDLPPPIFPGNFEKRNEVCIVGENLLKAVVKKKGFEWVNDQLDPQKPSKFGWTAYEPLAEISLKIDSDSSVSSSTLSIGYLTSYEQMGTFSLSCLSCECGDTKIDCHYPSRHVSLTSVSRVTISSHPECMVRIQILNETSSGKHKVKINAIILGTELQDPNLFSEQPWEIGAPQALGL